MYSKPFTARQRFHYGVYQVLDHFFGRRRVARRFQKQRQQLFRGIIETLSQHGEGRVLQVDRRKNLSQKEFWEEYVKKGLPVVFEGAAKEWPCCQNWSLDYFKELHGDDKIVMVDNNTIENDYESTTLAEVIDNIRSGGDKYYRFYPLLYRHPEHIRDFDFKWLQQHSHKTKAGQAFQVFIGGKGRVTPIHSALSCNLFTQAYGEKKWVLYPNYYTPVIDPEPARNLYRSAPVKTELGCFDPFNPNYDPPYGLYKYIDSYEVHLKQGDVLWNPPYFWHAVTNLTDSIGVGYRWVPPFYCMQRAPLYAFLDMFGMNPPIWKSWGLSKKDFNLVQLAETGRLDQYLKEQKKHK
jgi:lysine-specific demethylase 8